MEDSSHLRETMMRNTSSNSSSGESFLATLQSYASTIVAAVSSCTARRIRMNDRVIKISAQLAEGGFSTVFKCEVESGPLIPTGGSHTSRVCVLKQIYVQSPEAKQAVHDEISAHVSMRGCKRIMPLIDHTFETVDASTQRAYLLFPFYSRGSMQDFLLRHLDGGAKFFEESVALRFTRQICEGLSALHHDRVPLAHRDLCPRNVMIDDNNEAVIIDLGSVTAARVPITSRFDALRVKEQAQAHSSMPYRAVELWEPPVGSVIDERTDVWSLGATLYALLFGYSPFESSKSASGTLRIAECTHLRTLGEIQFPTNIPISMMTAELIQWMLSKDHATRPSVAEVSNKIDTILRKLPRTRESAAIDITDAGDEFNPFVTRDVAAEKSK